MSCEAVLGVPEIIALPVGGEVAVDVVVDRVVSDIRIKI
jgi:hypothetical protein